jgi:hypothetical protein
VRADRRDHELGVVPPHGLPVADAATADEPGGVDPERPAQVTAPPEDERGGTA